MSGVFPARNVLDYLEREYSGLDTVVSERVLAQRLVGRPSAMVDPLEPPQAAWNATLSSLANPVTGTVVLANGVDTGGRPDVYWDLKGSATMVSGDLTRASGAKPGTCDLPSAAFAAAIEGFIQSHGALFGIAPGNEARIKVGYARQVAKTGSLCVVQASQTSDFPLVNGRLTATFGQGGQLLSLSGEVDPNVSGAPQGPASFDYFACERAKSAVETELRSRGVKPREPAYCSSPVTVALANGAYWNALSVIVPGTVPFWLLQGSDGTSAVLRFYVEPSRWTGAILAEEKADLPNVEVAARSRATVYDPRFDPDSETIRWNFLSVFRADPPMPWSSVLRGWNGEPWSVSYLDEGKNAEVVATAVPPDPWAYDYALGTTGYDATTCFTATQQYTDRLKGQYGFGSPLFGVNRSTWTWHWGAVTVEPLRVQAIFGVPGGGSTSSREGELKYVNHVSPATCVHELYHQVQWEYWDPKYEYVPKHRMTEAIVEGMARFVQTVNTPYPVYEVDVVLPFIPFSGREFRATTWPGATLPYQGSYAPTYDRSGPKPRLEYFGFMWLPCPGINLDANMKNMSVPPRENSCVNIVPLDSYGKPIFLDPKLVGNWDWDGVKDGVQASGFQDYEFVNQVFQRLRNSLSNATKWDQTRFTEQVATFANLQLERSASLNAFRATAADVAGRLATDPSNVFRPVGMTADEVKGRVFGSFDLHGVDDILDAMCRAKVRPCG